MTGQHDLDHLFPAGIDETADLELRQLFEAARAPGQPDELAAEDSVVAMMVDVIRRQTATLDASPRRSRFRVVASRGAAMVAIAGFVVVTSSVAAAAGVLPQPMQSVFERAVRIAGWHVSDHAEATSVAQTDREPTTTPTTTTTTEASTVVRDVIVLTTAPAPGSVDRDADATALCSRWELSIRSGAALEADAKRALVALAAHTGETIDRLCGSPVSNPDEAAPTVETSPLPQAVTPGPMPSPTVPSPTVPSPTVPSPTVPSPTVPSPTVPAIDAPDIVTADPPPASTDDGNSHATPTLPPQANGHGPPSVSEPSPAHDADAAHDESAIGTPSGNANANGDGSANANGGNPSSNANASDDTRDRGNAES